MSVEWFVVKSMVWNFLQHVLNCKLNVANESVKVHFQYLLMFVNVLSPVLFNCPSNVPAFLKRIQSVDSFLLKLILNSMFLKNKQHVRLHFNCSVKNVYV